MAAEMSIVAPTSKLGSKLDTKLLQAAAYFDDKLRLFINSSVANVAKLSKAS
jgi:hypothetical protein